MKTLEPKHLYSYMPYGLQMKCDAIFRPNHRELPRMEEADATLTPDLLADIYNKIFDPIDKFKPILHPLSDLTKEIKHNEDSCTLLDMINIDEYRDNPTEDGRYPERKGRYFRVTNVWYTITQLPYWKVEKLFEWHIDFYGLIEQELAIDINTLKENE